MSNIPSKSGPILPATGITKSMVILLHGYGADAADLFSLAQIWQPSFPNTVFVSLNAPEICEANPAGRQWFSLFDLPSSEKNGVLTYWPAAKLLSGARMAAFTLDHWIDDLLGEFSLDANKLVLAGFSQGAMLAMHVGLRRAKPIAGIVGYSGRLLAPELLGEELRSKPPVVMTHGDMDDVVPPESLLMAQTALESYGVAVTAEMHQGLGHSINQRGLDIAAELFARVL